VVQEHVCTLHRLQGLLYSHWYIKLTNGIHTNCSKVPCKSTVSPLRPNRVHRDLPEAFLWYVTQACMQHKMLPLQGTRSQGDLEIG
jgi:hypothetical protein